YFVQRNQKSDPAFIEKNIDDICASVQYRIVTILLNKLEAVASNSGIRDIAIAGGVSANSGLRYHLEERGKRLGWNVFIPKFEYCTDNAAMVSIAGYYKYLKKDFTDQDVSPLTRWTVA